MKQNLSQAENRVFSVMKDGKGRTTRQIVIQARVSDAGREIRRMIAKGYLFSYVWETTDGNRYKIWRYGK